MSLVGKTCPTQKCCFLPEGKPTVPVRIYPADGHATSLPPIPWNGQILCGLTFGDHEALKRNISDPKILTLTWGKQTNPAIRPMDRPTTRLPTHPKGGPQLCWLAFGDHEVLMAGLLVPEFLIPV